MKYAEKLARDLACGVLGCAPGSVAYHATVGMVREVLEDAAREAKVAMYRQHHPELAADAYHDIRALADRDVPETGTPGSGS